MSNELDRMVLAPALPEQQAAERETRFQLIDDIKQRLPDLPQDEVLQDVAAAIAAVRKQWKIEAAHERR